jgi:hypothetical protein
MVPAWAMIGGKSAVTTAVAAAGAWWLPMTVSTSRATAVVSALAPAWSSVSDPGRVIGGCCHIPKAAAHAGWYREVTPASREVTSVSGGAVDALTEEVGVAVVAGVLLDHVEVHPAEIHLHLEAWMHEGLVE